MSVCTWASISLMSSPVMHTSLPQSLLLCVSYKHLSSQWRRPPYSACFLGFPDYGFYSGPGDQRGVPCSFADYATLGPHTGQMLQSEHVTSTCNSPSQHHPSPDHFKSSGVYGIFCPRHVLLLKTFPHWARCKKARQIGDEQCFYTEREMIVRFLQIHACTLGGSDQQCIFPQMCFS